MKKQTKTQRINAMFAEHPDMKPSEIAKRLKVTPAFVHQVKYQTKKNSEFVNTVFTKAKKKPLKLLMQTDHLDKAQKLISERFDTEYVKYKIAQPDPVNHPPHYKTGGIETIDFIEAKDLNYRLGNVIKYVTRAGRKSSDPIEDLQKAAWYLQREIDARKNA
jgi:hypothetical protein